MAAAAIKAPSPAVPPPGAPGGDAGAGAANAAEALRQRYRRACEERRVQPIAPLQRLLDGLLPTKHNAVNIHSLLLRGSQPELFDARVSYNQLDAMTETLKGVCPMHTLDLSYNFIDDTGAKLVAEFLRETSVKVVNVSGNDIGAAGMLSIAEAAGLTMRGGMQELLVGGNLFGLEGAKALASLIGSSRSLLVLNMKGCGIGLDGLIHITAALSAGGDLTRGAAADAMDAGGARSPPSAVEASTSEMMVSIEGSRSGSALGSAEGSGEPAPGAPAEAAGAPARATLEVLNFEDILQPGVQQEQAVHIAKMLACNSRLKELYIGKTGFRDLGCSTLVEYGLLRNSALTKLDLRCNQISLESGPVLNRLIRENGTLTSLNLSHNRLGDEGCAAIARALPLNTALSHLDVSSNGVCEPGLVALARCVADSDVVHVCCRGNAFSSDAGRAFLELIDAKRRRGDIVLLDVRPQEIDGRVMVAVDNNNI